MSHSDIANASKLPRSTVIDLSFKRSWAGVPVDTAVAFSTACGVNHLHANDQILYLMRNKQGYMKRGDGNQRRLYSKLLKIFEEHFGATPERNETAAVQRAA